MPVMPQADRKVGRSREEACARSTPPHRRRIVRHGAQGFATGCEICGATLDYHRTPARRVGGRCDGLMTPPAD
jgi:hypothetical protein